jgi:hypothetical protein
MIWAKSLEPRVISLECEVHSFDIRNPPNFLYLLGGDIPYTHFTMNTQERPTEPYFIAHLYPPQRTIPSPSVLSACQESRQVGLSSGYQPWTVESYTRGSLDIMWNPRVDVISLGREPFLHDSASFSIFLNQFPKQAKEVQRMATRSTHWRIGHYNQFDDLYPLTYFQALKELFVDDGDFWGQDESSENVYGWRRTNGLSSEIGTIVWELLGIGIGSGRTVATEIPDEPSSVWNPPKIHIVKDEDEILSGQEVDERRLICVSREDIYRDDLQTDD